MGLMMFWGRILLLACPVFLRLTLWMSTVPKLELKARSVESVSCHTRPFISGAEPCFAREMRRGLAARSVKCNQRSPCWIQSVRSQSGSRDAAFCQCTEMFCARRITFKDKWKRFVFESLFKSCPASSIKLIPSLLYQYFSRMR